MDREGALAVLRDKMDEAPLVRLAEALLEACAASATARGSVQVELALQAKACRVRHARVGVKKNA